MRKLIAVLVLFTLLAATAFAEVEVGAEIKGSWFVMEGEKDAGPLGDDLKPTPWTSSVWGGHNVRGRVSVTAVNEDETLGGWVQLQGTPVPDFYAWGNVWWQPISPFKATLGYIWGEANMIGDVVTVDDDLLPVQYFGRYDPDRYDDDKTFWTSRVIHAWGWESEDAAATIELFPAENLYVIATVPLVQQEKFFLGDQTPAGDMFAQTAARLAYTIDDVGQFAINWDGGTMTQLDSGWYDPAFIGVHFNVFAVENLEASIGFEFPLPISKYHRDYPITTTTIDADGTSVTTTSSPNKQSDLEKALGKFTRQLPLGLDLRANLTSGDFNLGFGLAAYFGGYDESKDANNKTVKTDDPLEFGITLNPSYDLGVMKAGLVGELGFTAKEDDKGDDTVSFNLIPYVQKDISAGSIYAGVQILGTSVGDTLGLNWAIPIGFVISF